MKPQLSLVFPAYNEAARIEQTITEAIAYLDERGITYEIIVAADGNDGTRDIVAAMGKHNPRIRVIGSAERRGKGYGLRQAIALCTGQYIGFSDADNKTPITEFDKFLPHLQAGTDVVIGKRPLNGDLIEQKQKWYRQIGSQVFKIYMHLCVGLFDILDTQCGFKFFQGDIAHDLFSRQQIDGYMYDVEILYLARQAGYSIEQVEVRWRDDADSRLNIIAGNIRNFRDTAKIRFMHANTRPALLPQHTRHS